MYFDYAATTPTLPEVIEEINATLRIDFGNPSSVHRYGQKVYGLLEAAREDIADILDVEASEIIFTSCATESNNHALIGAALQYQSKGRHIITTAVEHHSVLHTVQFLEDYLGFDVTYLPVEADGNLSLAKLKAAIRPDTILVSIMMVNNETGNCYDIAEIGTYLANKEIVFHTDAVQAMGKIEVYPRKLQVDLLSATAHKFGGPKGVGFLFCKKGIRLVPLLHGGEQEKKRRAGTENLASILGMRTALVLSEATRCTEIKKYQRFESMVTKRLKLSDIPFYINGSKGVPYILNLGFPKIKQDLLLMQLDLKGIAVSTGSACTAGAVEPSHVLEAMYGKNSEKLTENIRISFGKETTDEEIIALVDNLIENLK
ncbi:MAG: cysteine desulfurase [Streptococcaceae bacterium]|jgi:cysteine desulfurase|nr:cysteine desulfurase [Streptococcaceae bacterium]